MDKFSFFATTPAGLSAPCGEEIRRLARRFPEAGIEGINTQPGGVACRGNAEAVALLNMMLRIPSRILLNVLTDAPLGRSQAVADAIRSQVRKAGLAGRFMAPDQTFAVDSTVGDSCGVSQHFLALLVKDGLCDDFRDRFGARPNVDTDRPDVLVLARYAAGRLSLSLDTSGEALHKRGYRRQSEAGQRYAAGGREAHGAPMRENLAAGILAASGWQEFCWYLHDRHRQVGRNQEGLLPPQFVWKRPGVDEGSGSLPASLRLSGILHVPMCGGGTLAIEAARMLADKPLLRPALSWGFMRLLPFRALSGRLRWVEQTLSQESWDSPGDFGEDVPWAEWDALPIEASDSDPHSCALTEESARRGGVGAWIRVRCADFRSTSAAAPGSLVVLNPPYGVRLRTPGHAPLEYSWIGDTLKHRYRQCLAWVISADAAALKTVGLRPTRRMRLYSGGLECQLLQFLISAPRKPQRDALHPGSEPGPSKNSGQGHLSHF